MNRITRATMPLLAAPLPPNHPPVRAADGDGVGLGETAGLTFACSQPLACFISFCMGFGCVFCVLYRNISN